MDCSTRLRALLCALRVYVRVCVCADRMLFCCVLLTIMRCFILFFFFLSSLKAGRNQIVCAALLVYVIIAISCNN